MKNVGKWMLGAALAVGGLSLAATPAHAARIGVYIGAGPAAYVPPCPGPGYQWQAGYYDAYGEWMPGQWVYVGGPAYYGTPVYGGAYYYGHRDRDDWDHDRGWHGGWNRGEGDRGWHGDHYRGGDDDHHGWGRDRR